MNDGTLVSIRDGAVSFRVRSAGRGPHVVYFHSFHEGSGWSPFLDRLAARYTVHAPLHPGVTPGSKKGACCHAPFIRKVRADYGSWSKVKVLSSVSPCAIEPGACITGPRYQGW